MKFNFSLDAALIITVITALLFMIGQVHLGGYLRVFGADPTILNFSMQDKLYFGYLRAINHTIIFSFSCLFIFLVIPFFFSEFGGKNRLKKFLRKIGDEIQDGKHIPPIHNSSIKSSTDQIFDNRLFSTQFIIIILIMSLFYLAHIETKAKESAESDLNHYEKKLTKVIVKKSENELTYKVQCGQSLCAILFITKESGKTLHYIDPKEIYFPPKPLSK